jgi:TonB family protein
VAFAPVDRPKTRLLPGPGRLSVRGRQDWASACSHSGWWRRLAQTENKLRLTAEIKAMNTKSKIVLSLGLLLAPLASFASSQEWSYVESYHGHPEGPVPISVVAPEVDSRFAGQKVELAFVVDETGKPTLITSATPGADAELVAAVVSAVEQWKFSPARAEGKPVARKVLLPVKIVNAFDTATRFALN